MKETLIFLPADDTNTVQQDGILYSTAYTMGRSPKSNKCYIVEAATASPGRDERTFRADVCELARKLSAMDPWIDGLLKCKGIIQHRRQLLVEFEYVFSYPHEMQGHRSLRNKLLQSSGPLPSLAGRFRIVQHLAQSVSSVHTLGFVHHNIRPETILVFGTRLSALPYSFLVGFTNACSRSDSTRWEYLSWERLLYQHPERLELEKEVGSKMRHDIYSLGVRLLEIGLGSLWSAMGRKALFRPLCSLNLA